MHTLDALTELSVVVQRVGSEEVCCGVSKLHFARAAAAVGLCFHAAAAGAVRLFAYPAALTWAAVAAAAAVAAMRMPAAPGTACKNMFIKQIKQQPLSE